jgi:hypothetical protein
MARSWVAKDPRSRKVKDSTMRLDCCKDFLYGLATSNWRIDQEMDLNANEIFQGV